MCRVTNFGIFFMLRHLIYSVYFFTKHILSVCKRVDRIPNFFDFFWCFRLFWPFFILVLLGRISSWYLVKFQMFVHFAYQNMGALSFWYQRWSNLFFWPNPNPNIIRQSENFRIRIRILFEILKKIRIYSNLWKGSNIRILFE